MREVLVKVEEFKDSPVGRIPKDWDVLPLERVCLNVIDCPHTTPVFRNDGVLIARTANIRNGHFDELSASRISEEEYRHRVARLEPQPGDVIFTREAPVGEAFIVPVGMRICLGQRTMLLRPDPVKTISSYVLAQIYSGVVRTRIEQLVAGTTNPHLNVADVRLFLVPLPSLQEQRCIAEILDTVDNAIARTSSLITKLKQIKAGLLHDLLTRGLGEDGHLRDLETHPEVFKDSPLGRIPKDWDVMPIQKAASQVPGSTVIGPFGSNLLADDYRSTGVPVVFVRDIKVNGFQWNSYIYVEYRKARQLLAHSVLPGDLLATKMGLPPCIASVYPEWMPPGIITADIIRLRPDTPIATSEWLSMFINSDAVIRQVRGITGGVTRDKVTLQDFRKLLIALPNLKEQKLITNILDIHDTRIRKEEAYLNKLKLQKQGLMHDLLTGKVRVNDMK